MPPLRFLLLCLFVVLALPPVRPAAAAQPRPGGSPERRILVLDSNARDFPATELVERGLREALAVEPNAQLVFEYLSLTRFRDKPQRDALADLLRRRYGGERVDVVIGVGVAFAVFLLEYDTLFPDTPFILLCGIPEGLSRRLAESSLRDRLICLYEPDSALDSLVDSMLRLRPETRQVYLVSGISDSDRLRADAARRALAARADRVELVDLSDLPLGDVLERCAALPPEAAVFFSTLFVDARRRGLVPIAVLRALAASTRAPIFGQYEMYMGNGIVGGPLFSMRHEGRRAGEIALDCLRGRRPAAFAEKPSLAPDAVRVRYDWRQLRRHGIDEGLLPPGAAILYREAGLWAQYRYHIAGVILLLALQSALITGLVLSLRHRRRAQAALHAQRRDLEDLAGRLLSSQEEEVRRLSREFHDDYAQRLAAVVIEIGVLELQAARGEVPSPERIGHIKSRLVGLSDDIHALSRELHPAILKDLGLKRALESLCLGFADREGVAADCRVDPACDAAPADAALCAYRVVQEALRNVAKHARAGRALVEVRREETPEGPRLVATVTDDGRGFDPGGARRTPGIGLAGMKERVQYARGEFTLRSAPGQGTMVRLSLPLERNGR